MQLTISQPYADISVNGDESIKGQLMRRHLKPVDYGELGDRCFAKRKFAEAAIAYERAVQIARERGVLTDQCRCLGNLGVTHLQRGNPEEAVTCLREALAIADEIHDVEQRVYLLDNLGKVYWLCGLHATAVDVFVEALNLADSEPQTSSDWVGLLTSLHGDLGNVFSSNGAYHRADPHYRTALELARSCNDDKAIALWLGNLGNNCLGLQQYRDAVSYFEQAIQRTGSASNEVNVEKWHAGLQSAKERLARQLSAQDRGPAAGAPDWPGPFSFGALALRLGDIPNVREKVQLVQSEQQSIATIIDDAIRYSSPKHALALIDRSKSLIGQGLVLQKRAQLAGLHPPDLGLTGAEWDPITHLFTRESGLVTITFYYSQAKEFYALIAYLQHLIPHVEKVVLADGSAGKKFHATLVQLARTRRDMPFASLDTLVLNILSEIGEAILPRLEQIEGIKKILIMPYKLLHLLPLHAILQVKPTGMRVLEEIAPTTYASSLNTYLCRGKLPRTTKQPRRRALALIDAYSLGRGWALEYGVYRHIRDAARTHGADENDVTIVTATEDLRNELGLYHFISWSSHAYSDPSDWSRSYLQFGDTRTTALEILDNWHLWNTATVILPCCETGSDKSMDDSIDEYFGLDMAVHAAGAQCVISTLWPVEESLASLMSLAFAEGIIEHLEIPSEYLRRLRLDLVSGQWKDRVESNYLGLSKTKKRDYADLYEPLLEMERDRFQRVASWAAWRTFGGW